MPTEPVTEVDPFEALASSLGDEPEEATDEQVSEAEPEESTEEEASDEAEAEEVVDEIEFDNKKVAIPKGTPPELVSAVKKMADDLKADYTRKTQEAASIRQTVQQRQEAIEQQERILSQNFERAVAYKQASDRVSQFEQLDWQAIVDEDPQKATKLNFAFQEAQRNAAKLYQELQRGAQESQQMTAQQRAQMLQEGQKEIEKHIKGWGPDVQQAIGKTMRDYGISEQFIANVADPAIVRAMYDAYQWRKLQADKPTAMKKVADAPKALKPGGPPRNTNREALTRLQKHGRIEDLASLL
jgi:hypothetical protein